MNENKELQKKLKELFGEVKKQDEDFQEIFVNGETNFDLQDLSKEEIDEIKQTLIEKQKRTPKKPKKIWKWNFGGRLLLKYFLFVLEFAVLSFFIWLLVPLSINTNVTLIQSVALTSLMTIIRFWWK